MSAGVRAILISFWVLVIGLTSVSLEVEEVRSGARVTELLLKEEDLLEEVRLLELRYNRMLSPDLLQKDLPPEFRSEDDEDDPSALQLAKRNRE